MTFELAEDYARPFGLHDSSSRHPQGVSALRALVSKAVWDAFDWDKYDTSAIFDHTRVLTKTPGARTKAYRVCYSPYPSDKADAGIFHDVADALGLQVIVGDEAHRTYEVLETIPVVFIRP